MKNNIPKWNLGATNITAPSSFFFHCRYGKIYSKKSLILHKIASEKSCKFAPNFNKHAMQISFSHIFGQFDKLFLICGRAPYILSYDIKPYTKYMVVCRTILNLSFLYWKVITSNRITHKNITLVGRFLSSRA